MNNRLKIFILTICIAGVAAEHGAVAGSLTISKSWVSGDTLDATDLNQNFTDIQEAVDDNFNRISNSLFFSGDGSAGVLTVSQDATIDTLVVNDNYNFTNCAINTGVTLTVPAGTVIRCAGTFVNNGTVNVDVTGNGGFFAQNNPAVGARIVDAGTGDSPRAAGSPAYHTSLGVVLNSPPGGTAIPRSQAATAFENFRIGGGGGSGHQTGSGGSGGGLVKIYSRGSITNSGTITANAGSASQGGGGGGGIVVLASMTDVNHELGANINTRGGNGNNSDTNSGVGGGGGGGIIVMVAPTVVLAGGTDVSAGSAGTIVTNPLTSGIHSTGGAGGGSGGSGGEGGRITAENIPIDAGAGMDGYVLTIQANPLGMMH